MATNRNPLTDLHAFFTNLASLSPERFAEVSELVAEKAKESAQELSIALLLQRASGFEQGQKMPMPLDNFFLKTTEIYFNEKNLEFSTYDKFTVQREPTAGSLAGDFLSVRAQLQSQRAELLSSAYQAGVESGRTASLISHKEYHDPFGKNALFIASPTGTYPDFIKT